MITFDFLVRDESGIHARPAGILVKKLQEFGSSVTIAKGDKTADGKKLFQVMKLGVRCGDTILFTVDGEDEEQAAEAARTVLEENL